MKFNYIYKIYLAFLEDSKNKKILIIKISHFLGYQFSFRKWFLKIENYVKMNFQSNFSGTQISFFGNYFPKRKFLKGKIM
jgi:hypothetical protein